jgi:very-short-patch-repair endonuclease
VIEVDGSQHAWTEEVQRDLKRDARLANIGFKTLRFWNIDIDKNINGVIERILSETGEEN